MFAKLLIVILAVAVTGAALLVSRQQRLDAVHEAAQIHRRLNEQRVTLWRMQVLIEERCRPEAIREAIEADGRTWVPILDGPPADLDGSLVSAGKAPEPSPASPPRP